MSGVEVYGPGEHDVVVPEGAQRMRVVLWGGLSSQGELGEVVRDTVPVEAGQTLNVSVGPGGRAEVEWVCG